VVPRVDNLKRRSCLDAREMTEAVLDGAAA
jgi:hypothetical protein